VEVDGCIFLRIIDHDYLIVWPTGAHLARRAGEQAVLGPANQVIAVIGTTATLSGGFIEESGERIGDLLDGEVPRRCVSESYFLVSPHQ
jgi:hypothetical protein